MTYSRLLYVPWITAYNYTFEQRLNYRLRYITTLALTYLTTTGTTNDNLLIIVSLAQLWLPYRQGKLF